jgi:hypothetical protein
MVIIGISTRDICYLQADNNSTDIHLNSGEMVTAFKTLKHFEGVIFPFVRIHNSYIVNTAYISRIHTGNSVCYIKNTAVKLPFSKSYKVNVDLIITEISNGNYLEFNKISIYQDLMLIHIKRVPSTINALKQYNLEDDCVVLHQITNGTIRFNQKVKPN